MSTPKIWYIQPESHTQRIFTDDDYQRMLEEFDTTVNDTGRNFTSEEVAEGISGYDAIITGWGAPPMTAEIMKNADDLKIIAHSAGSIKGLCPKDIVENYLRPNNIILFSANGAIAYNVAESAVGMIMMASHRWMDLALNIRQTGTWRPPHIRWNGQFLLGSTVGVVSASSVGRHVIHLLQGWECELLLYDPYISAEAAAEIGAEKVELNELFERSDHVTIHAPKLDATYHMIGAEQLQLLKDNATLVNTSRGTVIDQAALVEEAATGRIQVFLDVTDPEPMEPHHPFRAMPNVYISPHVSGAGYYGYHMIGTQTVNALEAAFAGEPMEGAVDYDKYDILA
ncbi:MAG: hydroxyacid dehydrogenase [Armatimonadota bacterium]